MKRIFLILCMVLMCFSIEPKRNGGNRLRQSCTEYPTGGQIFVHLTNMVKNVQGKLDENL